MTVTISVLVDISIMKRDNRLITSRCGDNTIPEVRYWYSLVLVLFCAARVCVHFAGSLSIEACLYFSSIVNQIFLLIDIYLLRDLDKRYFIEEYSIIHVYSFIQERDRAQCCT